MTLFSAFRTPVEQVAFARVFRNPAEPNDGRGESVIRPSGQAVGLPLQQVLAELNDAEFEALLARLVDYRLLRHNATANTYTTHPLVRSHYLALLTRSGQAEQTHDQLKAYYLALAGDTPHQPTLADLAPLIEVVYHACRAGAYDEAFRIDNERVQQGNRWILTNQFGAYETRLAMMIHFFPNGDISQNPQLSHAKDKSWVLNVVGGCMMRLGQLITAASLFERAAKLYLELGDRLNASSSYSNLAELNAKLGRLVTSAAVALDAFRCAETKMNECVAIERWAHTTHLLGKEGEASVAFRRAEALVREIDNTVQYLNNNVGIEHAEHLFKLGQADYARRITTANLTICEQVRWPSPISMCHRVLGELDADEGNHPTARDHFDTALTIARSISVRDVLIEALLARGRWAAKLAFANRDLTGAPEPTSVTESAAGHLSGLYSLPQAFSDLREALGYATDGGYRLYEADSRVALAWAYLASNNPAAAKQEATRVQTMSIDMGYHWGQVDAAEILDHL